MWEGFGLTDGVQEFTRQLTLPIRHLPESHRVGMLMRMLDLPGELVSLNVPAVQLEDRLDGGISGTPVLVTELLSERGHGFAQERTRSADRPA
jgi:hypothetical protein